ncbi:hypothetical protein BAUCODRAFT_64035 [Baudoinia panamericana UAMH 10762]|uniref:2-methoxy-6-polyprenyl-1,4-benzoquinol methylase, mitochondrial n=1 Tax=Baudoinia panamericana (strain UAMH 10762) TaxID=717646 RepID=M2LZ23_BAUPA|nr:uncharacterized protein BAUCODRAFT_64035 [Baudoinia panamericana UAMH 10762]EMC99942.1 hypothetical protein BAUCODRAFT_64035 [Baudoinia panamericana UAMH 10762]
MAGLLPRASKRLRLASSPGWQQQQPATSQHVGQDENKTTHFGFETVAENIKASRVASVFSSVASNYDTMNDLMSLGIHRLWKDHFVRSLDPGIATSPFADQAKQGQTILDIAGGTGDIAFRMLDYCTTVKKDTTTSVIVSDINPDMLAEGRKRFSTSPYQSAGRVSFLEANAEDLSAVESSSIDLYTVAFGIRNFTHKEKALAEAFRVLKPGGVFACLEFTPRLRNPLMNAFYKRWSFGAIPLIGQIVAADRDSYQYLVESIERFPSQEQFKTMIQDAGFIIPGQGSEGGPRGWEDLTMGIAAIHKGVKPA